MKSVQRGGKGLRLEKRNEEKGREEERRRMEGKRKREGKGRGCGEKEGKEKENRRKEGGKEREWKGGEAEGRGEEGRERLMSHKTPKLV